MAALTEAAGDLLVHRTGIPYRMDEGLGSRARIGVIVLSSDRSIEHEFRLLLNLPGVAFYESRIPNSRDISRETLMEMAKDITAATEVIMRSAKSRLK